jgi:polyribonucleotide nucleotidyltransferase
VILYSFSVDGENPIDVLAINAASAALMISDVPWGGPVAAVRIGRINGELVVNPTSAEQDTSDLDLRIAGTRDAILMVECGSREVPEDVMVQALDFGHASIQPLIDIQDQMRQEVGKPKQTYPPYILAEAIQTRLKSGHPLVFKFQAPHTKAQLNPQP